MIDAKGNLVDVIDVPAGPGAAAIGLVGELWEGSYLYVLDQADNVVPHGRILRINPRSHAVITVHDGLAFPNGMAEDRHGNIYVTDSLLGAIYRFSEDSPTLVKWLQSPMLLSNNADQNVGAK